MTTPAEELRAAAVKLRELATAATSGPWAADASIPYGHRVGSSDEADWVAWTGEHGEDGSEADAAYIASMHPGVGLMLADWLDCEARTWDNPDDGEPVTERDEHALAVARAIGGPS